jgi:DNA-binding beta-propeller fold protein YncE
MVGVRRSASDRERAVKVKCGGRARCGIFALSLVVLVGALSGVAQAAPEIVAKFGPGLGQVVGPNGVAIDPANSDLYVADSNNFRIDKFDPEGNFLFAAGLGVRDGTASFQTCGPQAVPPTAVCRIGLSPEAGGISPEAVAVDSSGAIYASSSRRVVKFTSAGEFVFTVGRNVNQTKAAESGATQSEKDFCSASGGGVCGSAESGSGPNEFSGTSMPLAIDSVGGIWVGDMERLISFDSAGVPGPEVLLPGADDTKSLALDSSDNFFVRSYAIPGIRKFEAGSNVLLGTLDAEGQARPVALDEDDNVYIGDATSPYRFKVYNSAGDQISQFGAGQVIGTPGDDFFGSNAIAVDGMTGKLYAASSKTAETESVVQAFALPGPGPLVEDQGVMDLLPTTARLTARINPENEQTTFHFEYGADESYGHSTSSQVVTAEEFEPEEVEAQIEGLIPSTTYHFRVVATSHCNPTEPAEVCTAQVEDQTLTTLPAVVIDPQWVTDVLEHSAVLHGELDPLGVEAEAWLEYGTDEAYGEVVSLPNLGSGFGPIKRQVLLTGLQAGTTYHYRFAARDERDGVVYTVHGSDHSFTTAVDGVGFQLPDNRVWELVSPAEKHGARLVGGGEIPLQASADGRGLAYQSLLSLEADPDGSRVTEASANLAHRDSSGSWSSQDLTPPNDRTSGLTIGNGTEYKLFSSDLSEAVLEPRSGTLLSPEASERTAYLRENTSPPVYTPLVTGKEPYANVPPDIEFSGIGEAPGVSVVAASSDFRHFALSSAVPLVEGTPVPAPSPTLYEWSSGLVKPVSVLPVSEGGALVSSPPGAGSGIASVRGAISQDGSRVFWSAGPNPAEPTALYVRDTDAEETARLDLVQSGAGAGAGRPIFQGASADGSIVFFTDSQQLTEESPEGVNLYRCELPPGSIALGCAALTDISRPTEAGERADVLGLVPGFTADAKSIYLVARGALDTSPNQLGDSAVVGEPNLYLWEQGEGARFIASLGGKDSPVWGVLAPGTPGRANALSASASPSGRYLAFMSQRSLTGYDNRDATNGEPVQEMFRYDALADRLECVSCNPGGERPESAHPSQESFVNPIPSMWVGQRAAAILPEASTRELSGISLYRSRAVLDNGRVFFNAIDPLVSADTNGQWDVYEYEPTGIGECVSSSGGTAVARSAGGCVSLVSSGTAEDEAAFVDASETGDDIFFFSSAQLSVLDGDQEVDMYDARVDGVAATLPAKADCVGEACQPLAQAPSASTPASAAFRGAGNRRVASKKHCPKSKRRVRRHGRVRCVPKKQRRGSSGKHRRATGHRSAPR